MYNVCFSRVPRVECSDCGELLDWFGSAILKVHYFKSSLLTNPNPKPNLNSNPIPNPNLVRNSLFLSLIVSLTQTLIFRIADLRNSGPVPMDSLYKLHIYCCNVFCCHSVHRAMYCVVVECRGWSATTAVNCWTLNTSFRFISCEPTARASSSPATIAASRVLARKTFKVQTDTPDFRQNCNRQILQIFDRRDHQHSEF